MGDFWKRYRVLSVSEYPGANTVYLLTEDKKIRQGNVVLLPNGRPARVLKARNRFAFTAPVDVRTAPRTPGKLDKREAKAFNKLYRRAARALAFQRAMEEANKGEWTHVQPLFGKGYYKCSNCKEISAESAEACPCCGTRMRRVVEDPVWVDQLDDDEYMFED